jgi:hypothetical protein
VFELLLVCFDITKNITESVNVAKWSLSVYMLANFGGVLLVVLWTENVLRY